MADAETLRQVAQSRAPLSAWLGIVILFSLFGVIVLAIVGPTPRGDSYEQNRAKRRLDLVKAARDEEAKTIASYAWVDKSKGVARIPVDRAMQLTMAELAQKKPAPAYPIATPPPPATAASPAPSAPAASPSAPPSSTPKAKAVAGPESENRGQPAGASNPPGAAPGTQPGASATPMASPAAPSGKPAVSPSGTPVQSPPGSPLPVREKSPGES